MLRGYSAFHHSKLDRPRLNENQWLQCSIQDILEWKRLVFSNKKHVAGKTITASAAGRVGCHCPDQAMAPAAFSRLLLHQQCKWKLSCSRINHEIQKVIQSFEYLSPLLSVAEHSHKKNYSSKSSWCWHSKSNPVCRFAHLYKVQVKFCKQDINSAFMFAAKSSVWWVPGTSEGALSWILLLFLSSGHSGMSAVQNFISLPATVQASTAKTKWQTTL